MIAHEDLTITHARYTAGEHIAGPHIHHRHTHAFYVLEGELIFEIGPDSEAIFVSAGEFVAAPPWLTHSFRVAESGPARWLTIHAPDGGFAAFMRGLRPDQPQPATRRVVPETIPKILTVALVHATPFAWWTRIPGPGSYWRTTSLAPAHLGEAETTTASQSRVIPCLRT